MCCKIQWLGQGGYLLESKKTRLCIDPYLSNSVAKLERPFERLVPILIPPQNLACDAVLCTHDHADHLDPETIGNTRHDNKLFIGPDSCVHHFRSLGVPEMQIRRLNCGQTMILGDMGIKAVFAMHTADSIGIVVSLGDLRIYFTGDTLYCDELIKVSCDILVICINGKLGNMNDMEAVKVAKGISPRIVIPAHYGMFKENTADPSVFCRSMHTEGIHCFMFGYGDTIDLDDILRGKD